MLGNLLELDRRALLAARTHGHGGRVERVVAGYSRVGEHAAGWLALGLAGRWFDPVADRRRRWWRGAVIVASAYGLNYGVKLCARRPRPHLPGLEPLTPVVSGLSLPSAHATTSFAAARAYAGLAPAWLLYAAAFAFAYSRPYLGVHYPSDVVIGAVLGTCLAGRWPQ